MPQGNRANRLVALARTPAWDAERLDDADLGRHERMLVHLQDAQALAAHAQQLQQRANDLSAAFRIWSEELHDRYGLARDGSEGVNPDGTINRQDLTSPS